MFETNWCTSSRQQDTKLSRMKSADPYLSDRQYTGQQGSMVTGIKYLKGSPVTSSSAFQVPSIAMKHPQIVVSLSTCRRTPDRHLVHEHCLVNLLGFRICHAQIVQRVCMLWVAGQCLFIQLNTLLNFALQQATVCQRRETLVNLSAFSSYE